MWNCTIESLWEKKGSKSQAKTDNLCEMHLKIQPLIVIHSPQNKWHWEHKWMQYFKPSYHTDLYQGDLSQMSIYSKGEVTSEQISVCPPSPWTVCQAESTSQETIKASNEDLTHKAALMYKSTLQVLIVVISQCPACEMQSQVVYTCFAGLQAVKVRYLELVVTWTPMELR